METERGRPGRELSDADERALAASLVGAEVEQWAMSRTAGGLPALDQYGEQATAAAVLAALFGLGRLQPLLDREDVENVHIHGADRVVLELADGRTEPGPPVAGSDAELVEMLTGWAARAGQTGREFSPAHPVLNPAATGGWAVGLPGSAASPSPVMTDIANATSETPRRYQRVPFELAGSAPRRDLPDPTGIYRGLPADDDEQLIELLARAFSASVDPREVASIRSKGARELTAWMIHDAQAGTGYEADRGWWSIIAMAGVPAGLVLPVVFTGCARGNLDEGTIYHIAVVPEHRGHGLGRLLLGRATDTLLAHGVWQITTDTAAENTAMIRVFTALGYTRHDPFLVET